MHPHIKKSGTSSDTPADDGRGAPPPATDDWQTPQPPIGDESDTSDAHIDDESDLPAIPRYEVALTPSGASLQRAPYVIMIVPQSIHNDNAAELSDTGLNHFSGVKLLTSSLPSTETNHEDQVPESVAHVEGLRISAEFRTLMVHAVPLLDIVVGTPVALVELAQHTDFDLQLIIVDEAARRTEDLSLAFQAEWQSALYIHIGDTQQLPPIGFTVRQPDSKAVFSYQRQTSLARLRRNYHARVNAVS
ncbi:hypothetical protein FPANT_8973 [Fusarium pseudoanthophilum]|uniref:DNA2/NAM7 helicase helicase domain-containing protein n=1 Tax=Fusarium pseudoanthophilum TaxID=48495 RepID=A0A8H5L0B3_9HYPO|nr:hypothetical protein FPANT_8973 [Fusarium pseudoanthophilum]